MNTQQVDQANHHFTLPGVSHKLMSAFSTFQAVYHPVRSIVWFIACLTVSHLMVNNKPGLLTCMNNYNNVIIYNRVKMTLV